MKRLFLVPFMCLLGATTCFAQKQAEISFETTKHNFGAFPEDSAKQTCQFKFTNTGNAPLIIHQAVATCGCTVPTFTKLPVPPGKTGTVEVTYNGAGKFPGPFKKSVTVRTNAKTEMVRLTIEGEMIPVPPKK